MPRRIVFYQAGALGDLLLCFKALFAIKMLYKDDKLILFTKGNDKDFLEKISFIDEVIFFENFFEDVKFLKADIFINTVNSNKFCKKLKALNFDKIITHANFTTFFCKKFTSPLPSFSYLRHTSDIMLDLVSCIDRWHYKKHIKDVDFSEIKHSLPYDDEQSAEFFASLKPFKRIIAINAFGHTCDRKGENFSYREWLYLSFDLAKKYPNFCFILLNFAGNSLQYNIQESENLKIFVNKGGIASLFSFQKRLDYLISIDTSNVHISDILQVPSFVFLPLRVRFLTANGAYGGGHLPYARFVVSAGWQLFFKHFLNSFKKKLETVLNSF